MRKIRGVGGYGCVFEVVNKYDNWEYAVKRIAVDIKHVLVIIFQNVVFYSRDIDIALREVRAMAQFDHPNIVRYNGTWVERPPEGWQVRIKIHFTIMKKLKIQSNLVRS